MSKDNSTFSVSAAKALFEAAKKPEIRNAALAAAKNPFVRQAAKNVAQDEKARGAVLNAVKDPSAGNKFSAAFAVADANKRAGSSGAPPPPPPHRGSSDDAFSKPKPGKLSTAHFAISSKLENLHLGGFASGSSTSHSNNSTSYSSSISPKPAQSSSSSYSYSSEAPPPLPPKHTSSYRPVEKPASYGFEQISEPHGIAQYSYTAGQADEIALNVGDTIILKKAVDDEWIYGENRASGQTGIVPKSYLQIIIPLKETFSYSAPSSSYSPSQISATALYDYISSQPGDLNFSANQQIIVTSKVNAEWYEGEANGRKGIFPANFVNCSRIGEVPFKDGGNSSGVGSTGNGTQSLGTVTANFEYYSGVPSDLQFNEGDSITIVEDIDAQWIMGELNGRKGLVPKTFLGPPYGSPKKCSKGIAEISSAFSPKKGIAVGDYHSEDPKHLYVTRGDQLLIVEDVDEYYFKGKLEAFKTLPAGIVPKNVVKLSN